MRVGVLGDCLGPARCCDALADRLLALEIEGQFVEQVVGFSIGCQVDAVAE